MRTRSGRPVKIGVRSQEDDSDTLKELIEKVGLDGELVEIVKESKVADLGGDVLLLWYGDSKPPGYREILGNFTEDVRRRVPIYLFVRKDLDPARRNACEALRTTAADAVRRLDCDRAGLLERVQEVNFVLSEPIDFYDFNFRVPLPVTVVSE
jgi:hypothetical protein